MHRQLAPEGLTNSLKRRCGRRRNQPGPTAPGHPGRSARRRQQARRRRRDAGEFASPGSGDPARLTRNVYRVLRGGVRQASALGSSSGVVARADQRKPGPTAPQLIQRGDLLASLDRAAQAKVTLISGPPGSGKTSLLRAWADGPGAAVPTGSRPGTARTSRTPSSSGSPSSAPSGGPPARPAEADSWQRHPISTRRPSPTECARSSLSTANAPS